MEATYSKYILTFKSPSGTSRGVMLDKETWFIVLKNDCKVGIGECGILRGLSADDRDGYEAKLKWACDNIHLGEEKLWEALLEFPSIQFGVEMAFRSLASTIHPFELFPSGFTQGSKAIDINGLIWMGSFSFMKDQIEQKLKEGFKCIKLKIGAINFEEELQLLQFIRTHFDEKTIEIRVDANGAFALDNALDKLDKLSGFQLHSIEQPIKKGNTDNMSVLCKETQLPIALDEELIGVYSYEDKERLLKEINPQYIILKPSFIGGFRGTQEWIDLANKYNIGWWITSALESNIGLNAIAQWTYTLNNLMPQGLGTGSLFTNNFDSPLEVKEGKLWYNPKLNWNLDLLKEKLEF